MVEVTQEDRKAAWEYADFHCLPDSQMRHRWFSGYYDEQPQGAAIQALAHHRQAGVQQGLDMAAGVAKNERLAEPQDETDWAYESAIDDVLAAIRKLGGSDGTD